MPKLTDVLAALRAVRRRAMDGSLRPTDDVRAALDDVLALLEPLAEVGCTMHWVDMHDADDHPIAVVVRLELAGRRWDPAIQSALASLGTLIGRGVDAPGVGVGRHPPAEEISPWDGQ